MRLLLTGGGGAGNEAIDRLLGDAHECHFADADPSAIDPAIPRDRRHAIPFANEPGFADAVLDLARGLGVDVVVPGVDEELLALAAHREGEPRVMVPQADFVSTMLDKLASARAIAAAGLDAPETRTLDAFEGMAFPLVAKPRSGRGSRGVMVLDAPGQVAAYLALQGLPATAFVAQEMCAGQEYTVFVCADEGARLRAVVPVRVASKKGITIAATAEPCEPIERYAAAFQQAFAPRGIYNIQCTLDEAGRVRPFEVNPRVSTTFCLAVATGFDPFDLPAEPGPVYRPRGATALRRHWKNQIDVQGTGDRT